MTTIFPDPRKQVSKLEQVQHPEETRQPVPAETRWWKRPVPSYGFAILIVVIFTAITLLGENFLQVYHFPNSASLLVGILCVALFWGVGPGVLATLLSCAAFLYTDLFPPAKVSSTPPPFDWEIIFPVLLFAIASLVVVILIGQREIARRRALQAEQIAHTQASDLASANQELQRANQVKDLFVSITSHELKTPITTIRGQAQLALRRLNKRISSSPELEGLRDAFASVDAQTKRITTLIDELLDLTSLRSGKRPLEKRLCNLNEISANIIEEQRQASGRMIELDLPTPPVMLQADAGRIGQVLTNLVNNALKYSPSESSVQVRVVSEDSVARLCVRDAGRGISPEQMANIFQPFYRTADARASTVSGTGLGLAICKDIVDQHQGNIWCESVLGIGSTFFVELPFSPPIK